VIGATERFRPLALTTNVLQLCAEARNNAPPRDERRGVFLVALTSLYGIPLGVMLPSGLSGTPGVYEFGHE
jgi:hypothetical protein